MRVVGERDIGRASQIEGRTTDALDRKDLVNRRPYPCGSHVDHVGRHLIGHERRAVVDADAWRSDLDVDVVDPVQVEVDGVDLDPRDKLRIRRPVNTRTRSRTAGEDAVERLRTDADDLEAGPARRGVQVEPGAVEDERLPIALLDRQPLGRVGVVRAGLRLELVGVDPKPTRRIRAIPVRRERVGKAAAALGRVDDVGVRSRSKGIRIKVVDAVSRRDRDGDQAKDDPCEQNPESPTLSTARSSASSHRHACLLSAVERTSQRECGRHSHTPLASVPLTSP